MGKNRWIGPERDFRRSATGLDIQIMTRQDARLSLTGCTSWRMPPAVLYYEGADLPRFDDEVAIGMVGQLGRPRNTALPARQPVLDWS